jgi:hypothetical protein
MSADSPFRHLNKSADFDLNEYKAVYKNPQYVPWGFEEYADFKVMIFTCSSLHILIHSLSDQQRAKQVLRNAQILAG